jgi:hypothetical protein
VERASFTRFFSPGGVQVLKSFRSWVGVLAVIALASPYARAQDEQSSSAPAREYTAPLSQRTQPSYVPQSVALSGPRVIADWQEGDPVPPGYHPATHIRKGFVIAGSVVFGVFYLFSSLAAAIGADTNGGSGNPLGALWIPGVGPFVQMAGTSSSVGNWALAIDGLSQCGGLTMLIYGLTAPRTVLVRNDLGLRVLPSLDRGGGGFRLVGSF